VTRLFEDFPARERAYFESTVLEKFLEYARDQGLAGPDQTVESLFTPERLEEFAI